MKNKISLIMAVAFIVSFVSGFVEAKAPDWINGVSKKYPEPEFFIGIGEARIGRGAEKQVIQLASDRARGEIAKTVRSNVKVELVSSRDSTATREKGKLVSQGRSEQSELIVVSAEELFDGVEIKDIYKDKRSQTLYALAVLNRSKMARSIEAKMEVVKTELLDAIDSAGNFKDAGLYLQAVGQYRSAETKAAELSKIRELYYAIRPAGGSNFEDKSVSVAEIAKIRKDLRSKISFNIKISGPAENIIPYIIRGLGSMGGAAADKKVYTLDGKTDVTYRGPLSMGEDLTVYVYTATADIMVKDSSGETIGALTFSASANEKTEHMAEKSAVRALGGLIEKQISSKISDM